MSKSKITGSEEELNALFSLTSTKLKARVSKALFNNQQTYDQTKLEQIKQHFGSKGIKRLDKTQEDTLEELSLTGWDITLLCKVLGSTLCQGQLDRLAIQRIQQVRNDYSHMAEDTLECEQRCKALCLILKGVLLFHALCSEEDFPTNPNAPVIDLTTLPTLETVFSRTQGPIWVGRWDLGFTPTLAALVTKRIREEGRAGQYLNIVLYDYANYSKGKEIHPRIVDEWMDSSALARFTPEWQNKIRGWMDEASQIRDSLLRKRCIVISTLSRIGPGNDFEALLLASDISSVKVQDYMAAYEGRAENREGEILLPPFGGSTSVEAWEYLHQFQDYDTKLETKDANLRNFSEEWEHIDRYWKVEPPIETWLLSGDSVYWKHAVEAEARRYNPHAKVSNLSMKMFLVLAKKYRLAYSPGDAVEHNRRMRANFCLPRRSM